MADEMTTGLLLALTLVGAWNALNMAARIYYRAPWWPYLWHVVTGAIAAAILWMKAG